MGRYLFLILLPFALITGCGPSTTARDTEKQQQNTFLRRQIGQMKTVEGKWVGCMTRYGGGKMPSSAELNAFLIKASAEQQVATQKLTQAAIAVNRGNGNGKKPKPPTDPIQVPPNPIPDMPPEGPTPPIKGAPNCKGGQNVVLQILVIDMLQADPTRNEVVEVPTLTGIFKTVEADNALVVFTSGLYRDEDQIIQLTSATVPGPTSSAIAPTILQVQMSGSVMSGRYIAPQTLADVTFTKVQ